MEFNKFCHILIFCCHAAFSVLSLVGYVLPYPDRNYECLRQRNPEIKVQMKWITAYEFVSLATFVTKFILDLYIYPLFIRMSRYYRKQFRSINGKYSKTSIAIITSVYIIYFWNILVSVTLLTQKISIYIDQLWNQDRFHEVIT